MDRRNSLLVLALGVVAAGCQTQVAPGVSPGERPTFSNGMISFTGTLRAPGMSTVKGAPAGEWLIEMPKDAAGNVQTTAVDVSAVAERARALEGKLVRASMRIPKQGDPDLGASTVKLTALEPR